MDLGANVDQLVAYRCRFALQKHSTVVLVELTLLYVATRIQ